MPKQPEPKPGTAEDMLAQESYATKDRTAQQRKAKAKRRKAAKVARKARRVRR